MVLPLENLPLNKCRKETLPGADITLPKGAAGMNYSVRVWEGKEGEEAKW